MRWWKRPKESGIGAICNFCAAYVGTIHWKAGRQPAGLKPMTDDRESRLLSAATLFLALYSLVLTLAPAVRAHTWAVTYRYSHWIGFAVWAGGIFAAHRIAARQLPDRDPYLLPLAAMLSGLGLLTVWRLEPGLGLRQALWLAVSLAAFIGTCICAPEAWISAAI